MNMNLYVVFLLNMLINQNMILCYKFEQKNKIKLF